VEENEAMALKRVLLGTTALLGAGMMAGVSPASAGTVTTASPFDLTISGYMRFDAVGGGIGDREYTSPNNSSFDFRTDNRLEIDGRAKDESTGIDYGFQIKIDAQAGANANGGNGNNIDVDEAWTWMRGSFGEFRFGDNDGITHDMSLGAWTIAVGTGGLDGTLVDLESTTFVGSTNDSTKIAYYSPTIGGFQLGLSYDPHTGSNGNDFAVTTNNDVQDMVDAGITYAGSFGAVDIKASVVGNVGRAESGSGDTMGIQPGAVISFGGFSIAGAYGWDETNDAKHQFYNLGAATKLGPVALSINWGQVIDTNNAYQAAPTNGLPVGSDKSNALIFGAQIGLVPGVWLSGEASHFDLDSGGSDDGWLYISRLQFTF
jgi:hypothetical protein